MMSLSFLNFLDKQVFYYPVPNKPDQTSTEFDYISSVHVLSKQPCTLQIITQPLRPLAKQPTIS
jgi:hypothetical protein